MMSFNPRHVTVSRYDDSSAVLRLLQSRQQRRPSREVEVAAVLAEEEEQLEQVETIVEMTDSGQEDTAEADTETELSSCVIYEQRDENTLI